MDFSYVVAGASLVIACLALFRTYLPPLGQKEVKRAFEALEEEFEDQRDHVRSALGRISRLRRGIMPSPIQGDGGVETPGTESDSDTGQVGSTLTARQAAVQSQIMKRRSKTDGLLRR